MVHSPTGKGNGESFPRIGRRPGRCEDTNAAGLANSFARTSKENKKGSLPKNKNNNRNAGEKI